MVVDLPQGANGERRQKWHGGFQTKKAAEAIRARLVHELTTGFYVEPSRMLLSEWLVDHWLPVHKTRVKKTTYRAYRSAVVHHISPRIGGVAIGKLKPQMLNNLYQQLLADGRCDGEGGLAPATVSGVHVVLRKALADAEDAGLIPRNPAIRAKPPRPKSQGGELRYWTPAELREFLGAGRRASSRGGVSSAGDDRSPTWRGRRVAMGRCRPRLRPGSPSVRRCWQEMVRCTCRSPKSGRGRTVDLDQATVDQLREHRERQLQEATQRRGGGRTAGTCSPGRTGRR